jgi:DNA polymerase IV
MSDNKHWKRAIILLDMDAFFASVEQLYNPDLAGKPVAVLNGQQGSIIITASYEARAFGIKTGMKMREAKQRCPQLIQLSASHNRYGAISAKIMASLQAITPDIEVYSIDEAFLDVTRCQKLHGDPVSIAHHVQACVWEASGLTCSVGVAGDKTTAKLAAGLNKPAGLQVIPPWEVEETLASISVSKLCGIGPAITKFLAKHGVHVCGDMKKVPVSIMTRRFGPFGYRMWMMCQGKDPAPVNTDISPPKSVGNGKVIPPQTRDKNTVLMTFMRMCEKVASRMRKNDLCAQHYLVAMKINFNGWVKHKTRLVIPSCDGHDIYQLCQRLIKDNWHTGVTVQQVQVTALDPRPAGEQTDLFVSPPAEHKSKHEVIDEINSRFGSEMIGPARALD